MLTAAIQTVDEKVIVANVYCQLTVFTAAVVVFEIAQKAESVRYEECAYEDRRHAFLSLRSILRRQRGIAI